LASPSTKGTSFVPILPLIPNNPTSLVASSSSDSLEQKNSTESPGAGGTGLGSESPGGSTSNTPGGSISKKSNKFGTLKRMKLPKFGGGSSREGKGDGQGSGTESMRGSEGSGDESRPPTHSPKKRSISYEAVSSPRSARGTTSRKNSAPTEGGTEESGPGSGANTPPTRDSGGERYRLSSPSPRISSPRHSHSPRRISAASPSGTEKRKSKGDKVELSLKLSAENSAAKAMADSPVGSPVSPRAIKSYSKKSQPDSSNTG